MRVLDVSSRETTIGCEQEHLGEELGVLHRGLRIQGVGRRRIKSAERRRAVARFDVPERANARGEWFLKTLSKFALIYKKKRIVLKRILKIFLSLFLNNGISNN